jgi:adhesin/invasin
VISSGNGQKAPVASPLPTPLTVKAKDDRGNGIGGIVVMFDDGGAGGSFSAATVTTDSTGAASTSYTTGTKSGLVTINASATGLTPAVFRETVLPGPPVSLAISSGNNQIVKAGAVAPKQLQVVIKDQYGNPVSGVSVNFTDSGAGGSFSPDPVLTNSKGIAGTHYTVPLQVGPVTVTASAAGLGSVVFTINVD